MFYNYFFRIFDVSSHLEFITIRLSERHKMNTSHTNLINSILLFLGALSLFFLIETCQTEPPQLIDIIFIGFAILFGLFLVALSAFAISLINPR